MSGLLIGLEPLFSGIPKNLHEAHQRRLQSLMWWLLTDLLLPAMRMAFYATESEPYKQQVFYYRREGPSIPKWIHGDEAVKQFSCV